MHACMNEWMNERKNDCGRRWGFETRFEGNIECPRKITEQNGACFFFHQTDGTISVPTWMMGLWFSQHPIVDFPANFDCWRVCLVIINTQPWNMTQVIGASSSQCCAVAQWRSGFFGAVENAAFWTWCLFFSSLFISLSGEKACKLQPCSIFKKIDSTIWRPPEFGCDYISISIVHLTKIYKHTVNHETVRTCSLPGESWTTISSLSQEPTLHRKSRCVSEVLSLVGYQVC